MAALTDPLRGNFEKAVIKAREEAEKASRAALMTLAVENDRPFEAMSEGKRALRRALRARARQLGEGDMTAGMPLLVEEIAYEQWHRMLFARFLAENDLLMHPEGVAVTLEECAELAQEEGAEDLWAVATRYASQMLPGIFRVDDPALQVRFAPEGRHKLEQIVSELPKPVFTSDDGLGWAYQFWQSKKKDEVNASERKIGGADIAPVTQLFTEDYMVKFLLHNTLGAWWAHRHPHSPLNITFEYLRYRDDGTPAAGTFDGWPEKAAEVTMMDPSGGSGHFVVAAFEMFTRMRMEEEGLSAAEAGDSVICDNVHMLEIDLRCTQIAAFNLTLTAWKNGGYRKLPMLNIACSGIPVKGQLADWVALAGEDKALQWTMKRLYELFREAPDLGSLINPAHIPAEERMFVGDYETVVSLLDKALRNEPLDDKTITAVNGMAIRGVAKAAKYLSTSYTLVTTNVPFLARGNQDQALQDFSEKRFPSAKSDLATVFTERCREFTEPKGSYAIVTPQNWLFLTSYKDLRIRLLREQTWDLVIWLGPGAFETISGEVVKPVLLVIENKTPESNHLITGLDASQKKKVKEKDCFLHKAPLDIAKQSVQLNHPDARVIIAEIETGSLLQDYAKSLVGIQTGDNPFYMHYFWEHGDINSTVWSYCLTPTTDESPYGGRQGILRWHSGNGPLHRDPKARIQGIEALGKSGVLIMRVGKIRAYMYLGELYDQNPAVILPHNPTHLPAIWAYCRSSEFEDAIRRIDKKLNVTNATLVKVPFDLEYWQEVADKSGTLPEAYSDNPTQWLFEGDPAESVEPLQVAVARLANYRWPEQEEKDLTELADEDGIVCLPSVAGEPSTSERLRSVLARTYRSNWSLTKQRKLLNDAGFAGKSIENWLRDGFFKQHCQLFEKRPFIWHIWDGRKDGFSALVNYHKLDHARLERLIYTYLGDWINTQRAEQEQGVAGADGRLVAALELKKKLELILEGEPPFDIYVRWKPLHEQPIGWNPDLNDGVRLNIRPFVTAGVLRSKFTIHWKKDRGKNPDGSERINDLHFTREEKLKTRAEVLGTV